MPYIVDASCPCGFYRTLGLDGGPRDRAASPAFPALCPVCFEFDVIGLENGDVPCRNCGEAVMLPYDDVALCGTAGDIVIFDCVVAREGGRMHTLTTGTYACSSCREKRLEFRVVGGAD